MLEDITGTVSLLLGSTMALYLFTKPRKMLDDTTRLISFKGAMKYSPAALRQRQSSIVDEMDM